MKTPSSSPLEELIELLPPDLRTEAARRLAEIGDENSPLFLLFLALARGQQQAKAELSHQIRTDLAVQLRREKETLAVFRDPEVFRRMLMLRFLPGIICLLLGFSALGWLRKAENDAYRLIVKNPETISDYIRLSADGLVLANKNASLINLTARLASLPNARIVVEGGETVVTIPNDSVDISRGGSQTQMRFTNLSIKGIQAKLADPAR